MEDVGISIRDFQWINDTDTYLKFLDSKWKNKETFLVEFEKELKKYPISCLKNIIHVKGNAEYTSNEMQKHVKATLIESYNTENDLQLKRKIAHALGLCYVDPPLHYFTIVLHDPDLCDKQRNKVWHEIIDRWRRNHHKTIDINNLRDALKAIYERPIDEKSRGATILKQLFWKGSFLTITLQYLI